MKKINITVTTKIFHDGSMQVQIKNKKADNVAVEIKTLHQLFGHVWDDYVFVIHSGFPGNTIIYVHPNLLPTLKELYNVKME